MVEHRRFMAVSLERALRTFRVVCLIGPRQVGKSTLVSSLPGRTHLTLDDLGVLEAATRDPRGFIASLHTPVTIDEVQRVPDLLLAIKERVDRDRTRGAFLLTGSARLDMLKGVRDSLAGRVAVLRMRPMTLAEVRDEVGANPVARLFESESAADVVAAYSRVTPTRAVTPDDVLAGGFPEPAIHLDAADRGAWFRAYRASHVERDVPAVLRVEDVHAFSRFVSAVAATSANLLNATDLARDCAVSQDTARRWLAVLETTLVADRLAPYARNVRTRLVKSPKVFLCDAGLMGHFVGASPWTPTVSYPYAGALWETWLHNELAVGAELAEAELAYFRTHGQVEVDFVLSKDRRTIPIELKSGATVRPADARGILWLREHFPRECPFGVVLYNGDAVFPLAEGVVAVPLSRFLAP